MFGMCKTKHRSKDIAKKTLPDLVGERASLFVINFEQVIKPFLFEIFISLFSYQWLIALFTKVLLRVTVYY